MARVDLGRIVGKDGLSAYEIAKENGFVGTEQEWLESLNGSNFDDTELKNLINEKSDIGHTHDDYVTKAELPSKDDNVYAVRHNTPTWKRFAKFRSDTDVDMKRAAIGTSHIIHLCTSYTYDVNQCITLLINFTYFNTEVIVLNNTMAHDSNVLSGLRVIKDDKGDSNKYTDEIYLEFYYNTWGENIVYIYSSSPFLEFGDFGATDYYEVPPNCSVLTEIATADITYASKSELDEVKKNCNELLTENEQLKADVEYWKGEANSNSGSSSGDHSNCVSKSEYDKLWNEWSSHVCAGVDESKYVSREAYEALQKQISDHVCTGDHSNCVTKEAYNAVVADRDALKNHTCDHSNCVSASAHGAGKCVSKDSYDFMVETKDYWVAEANRVASDLDALEFAYNDLVSDHLYLSDAYKKLEAEYNAFKAKHTKSSC